jgi:hypothetical protein
MRNARAIEGLARESPVKNAETMYVENGRTLKDTTLAAIVKGAEHQL